MTEAELPEPENGRPEGERARDRSRVSR
jgi:hypothetical protein